VTVESITPPWLEEFLRTWPGRFGYADLVRRLHGDGADEDPAECLLRGISAARTPAKVLAEFVERGEFQLAETLLAESGGITKQVRSQHGDLEAPRATRAGELANRLRTLSDQATAAGAPFEVDQIRLEVLTRRSWPAVVAELDRYQNAIATHTGGLRRVLQARNDADHTDPRLQAAIASLIAAGRLTLAQRVLAGGTAHLPVPEAQPALPPWRWSENPADVLRWHVDQNRAHPPEFSAWRAAGQEAQDLVEATEGLGGNGLDAAQEFAVALERFLHPDAPAPAVHEVGDGWLSTITLFQEPPLDLFRTKATVDLLILPPGVHNAPVLSNMDSYLVVGPDLVAGGGFRTGAAVLSTVDLLRLVTQPAGRAINLARIVGRQWPLAALGASTATALGRLLAEDPEHEWHRLGWLCDLAGLGGSATAEDLQFQAGTDAPVLHMLLVNRVGATAAARERIPVGVEGVVLRNCPDPAIRAAFWTALMTAPPGTPVSLDSLVVAAALSAAGDETDWEPVLESAFQRLREQWFVAAAETGTLTLRTLGVLTGLRGLAERRLVECAHELGTAELPQEQLGVPRAWSAHRYALSEVWAEYERLIRSAADPDTAPEPAADPDALIAAAAASSGSSDLAEVAGSIADLAGRYFPDAEFVLDVPHRILVAAPEPVLLTVLHELLQNAIDATDRAGKVLLSARVEGPDVLVDLFDNGPGLNSAIIRTAQVFRPGFSTRGTDRGIGLYLARRIIEVVHGELDVADRSAGHPVYKGAHFTLILPIAIGR